MLYYETKFQEEKTGGRMLMSISCGSSTAVLRLCQPLRDRHAAEVKFACSRTKTHSIFTALFTQTSQMD